ncbi:uncharacterized protein LOC132759400 [Ruditapes philippinarum]|uniref:uncharacterized protein LOC132759400 n=1 Tax=Ruditapes philippinarum TaxID=129788 RepID=UPI00295C28D2|nr:uncharacterized protein LOC132759400 [Ruditapes philippinarum]
MDLILKGNMFVLVSLFSLICVLNAQDATTCSKFDCEYNVLLKLIQLETTVADLTGKLMDAQSTITELNKTISTNEKSTDGTTYIRWGRTTCPDKAFLVYKGYVAGSHYTHSGTGSNPLCLPENPDYDKTKAGFQTAGRIYGAEYETNSYPNWKYLHNHEIPCAVCRIPRNNVLMVPGKDRCHDDYILEYKGYLMAEHFSHSASEFVCVDGNPETIEGTYQDMNGRLFYFVEGECGSLRCDPYKNGLELTCAVCSFSPNAKSTNLQPYV